MSDYYIPVRFAFAIVVAVGVTSVDGVVVDGFVDGVGVGDVAGVVDAAAAVVVVDAVVVDAAAVVVDFVVVVVDVVAVVVVVVAAVVLPDTISQSVMCRCQTLPSGPHLCRRHFGLLYPSSDTQHTGRHDNQIYHIALVDTIQHSQSSQHQCVPHNAALSHERPARL